MATKSYQQVLTDAMWTENGCALGKAALDFERLVAQGVERDLPQDEQLTRLLSQISPERKAQYQSTAQAALPTPKTPPKTLSAPPQADRQLTAKPAPATHAEANNLPHLDEAEQLFGPHLHPSPKD